MRFQLIAGVLIFSECTPKKSVLMLSEFQHPAAYQSSLLRLHQDPFTLQIRDWEENWYKVQSAKKKKIRNQRIKLLFWTFVRKMTENILNKTPLKFESMSQIFPEELLKLFRTHMNNFCTF